MTAEIEKKLDILIKLTTHNLIKEDANQTESILKLSKIGIGNKDLAEILNTTENYVNATKYRNKKKNGKKQKS